MAVGAAQIGYFWCVGQALHLDISLIQYVPIMVGPNLIRTVTVPPDDLGTYEVVVTGLLSMLGVEKEAAGAFPRTSHVLILGWTTVLGLGSVWLLQLQKADLLGNGAGVSVEEGGPVV